MHDNSGFLHCAAHDEAVSSCGRNDDFQVGGNNKDNSNIRGTAIADAWTGLALEGGVVGVALGAGGVEGCGVGTVEGAAFCESGGQIRICDEEFSEGYGVGFAFVEELLAGLQVDGFVGDEDSAEALLEVWADAVGAGVFAGGDEGDFSLAELVGDVGEGGGVVGVGDAVGVAAGG